MASLFKRLGSLLPARTRKGFAGYDLEGNSYFELPSPAGGRHKRTVEYKVSRDLAEYTSGKHRLPVQWTTWLSHTRTDAPSLEELQNDTTRQTRLKPMIEAIEAREQAERIRQGYLIEPGTEATPRGIAGPSRINTKPSFVAPPSPSQSQAPHSDGTTRNEAPGRAYDIPTATSPTVPPPPLTVDPLQNDDPVQLRKLAEEDTRRRIEQRGGEGDLVKKEGEKVEGVDVGGGGLAPRRRGKK